MSNLLKRLERLEKNSGMDSLVACWDMDEATQVIRCGNQTWQRQEGETLAELVARATAEMSGKPGVHWLAEG